MAKSKYSPLDDLTLTDDALATLNTLHISPDLPQKELEKIGGEVRDLYPHHMRRTRNRATVRKVTSRTRARPKTEEPALVTKFPYDPSVGFSWDGDV